MLVLGFGCRRRKMQERVGSHFFAILEFSMSVKYEVETCLVFSRLRLMGVDKL
jgi:hypothetical protein